MLAKVSDDAPYELVALPTDDVDAPRLLGWYRTYEQALRARDADVLDQLAAREGWYTVVEHAIVGPGLCGPRTVHRVATALGVDPATGLIPGAHDFDDARQWLATIRQP